VKMDMAIACFVRATLKALSQRVRLGKVALPNHDLLVADFHATVKDGTSARVFAPHLCGELQRDAEGKIEVRDLIQLVAEAVGVEEPVLAQAATSVA